MFLPGGLGDLVYRGRDAALRLIAARRGLVVPNLLADTSLSERDQTMPVPLRLITDGDDGAEASSRVPVKVAADVQA